MKNKKTIFAIILLLSVMATVKSQVSSIYFLKNVYYRHELNPAFQPKANTFVDLPLFPTLQLAGGNNSVTFSDIIYPKEVDGKTQTITFMHPQGDKDKFYQCLRPQINMFVEPRIDLLSFGFRVRNDYYTFGVTQKTNATFSLPKDLFKLALYGAPDTLNTNIFNLSALGVSGSSYTEFAFGYSKKINDKLTVGGKAKYLLGLANVTSHINNLQLHANRDSWELFVDGSVNVGMGFMDYKIDQNTKELIEMNPNTQNLLKFAGAGFAVDLGATYKVMDGLEVSASLLDLGMMRWSKNALNLTVNSSVKFEGISYNPSEENQDFFEEYGKSIADSLKYTTTQNPYSSGLQSKILLGAEYYVYKDVISIGVLSKMPLNLKKANSELSLFANFFPASAFNASLSYSLIHGKFSTIGIGLGGRLGPFNLFLAGDYIPFAFAPNYIPRKNKAVNLNMGLAIAIR